jgi:hypothetical protein
MKTLKNKETGAIRRVENKEADMITSGNNPIWGFVPKSEWKSNRKTNVVDTEMSTIETSTKVGKKKNKPQQ